MLSTTPPDSLLVACLCADWCEVCRDYRAVFEQMQQRFAQAHLLWIDVEDESDLLEPLEIEDFPTLLLAVGTQARFFGPVMAQAQTLERLIRAQFAAPVAAADALPDPALAALVGRLRQRLSTSGA